MDWIGGCQDMFDYIAPIPIDMQVLLLLDANICRILTRMGVFILFSLGILLFSSVNVSHIVSSAFPLTKPTEKYQPIVVQFSSVSQRLCPHVA
jgi:hypothetical protein